MPTRFVSHFTLSQSLRLKQLSPEGRRSDGKELGEVAMVTPETLLREWTPQVTGEPPLAAAQLSLLGGHFPMLSSSTSRLGTLTLLGGGYMMSKHRHHVPLGTQGFCANLALGCRRY